MPEPVSKWTRAENVGRLVVFLGAIGLAVYHWLEVEPDIDAVTLALLGAAVVAAYAHRIAKIGPVELSGPEQRSEVEAATKTAQRQFGTEPRASHQLDQPAATTGQAARSVLMSSVKDLADRAGLAQAPVGHLVTSLTDGVLDEQVGAALTSQLGATSTAARLPDSVENRRAAEELLASARSAAAYLDGLAPVPPGGR